jgi:hypothetical protein
MCAQADQLQALLDRRTDDCHRLRVRQRELEAEVQQLRSRATEAAAAHEARMQAALADVARQHAAELARLRARLAAAAAEAAALRRQLQAAGAPERTRAAALAVVAAHFEGQHAAAVAQARRMPWRIRPAWLHVGMVTCKAKQGLMKGCQPRMPAVGLSMTSAVCAGRHRRTGGGSSCGRSGGQCARCACCWGSSRTPPRARVHGWARPGLR